MPREPRPALRRADDGEVHPAAPRSAPEQHIHPAPHAPAAAMPDRSGQASGKSSGRGSGQGSDQQRSEPTPPPVTFDGKRVSLTVEVPKPLRKHLRKVATRDGRSVDDVVVDALTRYLMG